MRNWFLVVGLLLSGCAGSWQSLDRSGLPVPGDYPEQDAVVLRDHLTLDFIKGPEGPKLRKTSHRQVQVLTPKGSKAAFLAVGYNSSFSKVISVDARVSRPDGSVKTFTLADLGDHPSFGGSVLYDDSRLIARDFGVLPVGTVVEWRSVIESNTPTWIVNRYRLAGRLPVKSSRFEVTVPQGWQIESATTQGWKPITMAPTQRLVGTHTHYTWQAEDVAALKVEPLAPGISDLAPLVSVRLTEWVQDGVKKQAFADLQEYGRWMYTVQEGQNSPTPELEAQVKMLLTDTSSEPRAQAEKIYRWVQEKVRYVAVEVGMGGWRPHSAPEVFKYGYGDCKDKANLLRTMLSVAGIDSHLVELYSHGGVPRPFILPGVGNGNHAILAVHLPEGTVYTDPTERAVPFGDLPSRDQGAQVLLIHPSQSEVQTTPPALAKDNVKALTVELTLPKAGIKAKGKATMTTTGVFAWGLRRAVLTGAKGKEGDLFEGWDWLRGAKAKEVKFDTSDPRSTTATAALSLRQVGTEVGKKLVLRPQDFLVTPGNQLRRTEREHPVVFGTAITRTSELRIGLAGASTSKLPEAVLIESGIGRFKETWRKDGDVLIISSRYERDIRQVGPERYEEVLEFFEGIVQARARSVMITRGDKI